MGAMTKAKAPATLLFLPGGLAAGDDAALARALVREDPTASRVAWSRFAPMVHRMLKRALGPGQDVEDIAQEVFMTFFRKVKGLRVPEALRAFIIAITSMTVRYELRRRALRRWLRLGKEPVEEVVDAQAPSADSEAREALRRFYAILDGVNARDRTAFVLRFMEGLELTEVASALDISVATVKRRLGRVWERVARLVERDPVLRAYSGQRGAGYGEDMT
jgi:RNA polymerase sigma-70 factor, ECF subfamily